MRDQPTFETQEEWALYYFLMNVELREEQIVKVLRELYRANYKLTVER